jgi:hypothetical protein
MNENVNIVKWGILLWLFGYILGFILFFIVPVSILGWIITPFGIILTTYICLKKFNLLRIGQAIFIGFIWAILAILLDYLFIVKLLSPADGYYKLDVYFYYLFTLLLPSIVCILKNRIK